MEEGVEKEEGVRIRTRGDREGSKQSGKLGGEGR